MTKRVLLTGGTGFLGKHLQDAFKESVSSKKIALYPVGKKYDMTDQTHTMYMVEDFNPDVVIHAAALCGGILANANRPADFLRDNTLMGINIFEACRKKKVSRLYTLGSICSYPKHCPVPFKEDDIWNGAAEETNFPYGQAKRTVLMLGQTYRDQYGIGGAHLIPVNLYGEYDHFDLINSHVIPALINKFTAAKEQGKDTVTCWGTGEATREFLYAGDAAQAIAKAVLTDLDTVLPINLGTGIDISIKDLAYLVGQLTGFQGKIEFTGEVSDGQPKRRLDVSRAREMLNWHAPTDLETGLVKTIKWYQDNKDRQ